jgi:methylase of polypeptide subunit release factors
MNVFVSYSRADSPTRFALVKAIERIPGIVVLVDTTSIRPSEHIDARISEMIEQSDCVIGIITENTASSQYVSYELGLASAKPSRRLMGFVERSVQERDIPIKLRGTLHVQFSADAIDSALDELVQALTQLPGIPIPVNQPLPPTSTPARRLPSTVRTFDHLDAATLQRSSLGRELLEQVIAMCRVYPFEFEAAKADIRVPLLMCPNMFLPDKWTTTFLEGLLKVPIGDIRGKTIAEIGVGTGVIPITLVRCGIEPLKYVGYDIDTLAGWIAKLNFDFHDLSAERFIVHAGSSLFDGHPILQERQLVPPSDSFADLVIANVPQVPSLSTSPIRDQFDYYPVPFEHVKNPWAQRGLWLVGEILRQARRHLKERGSVVVALAGRPGKESIETLFRKHGYEPELIHSRRIAQDSDTDISAFVYFEKEYRVRYSFYDADEHGTEISADQAYDRICKGQLCFHDIFVFRGVPRTASSEIDRKSGAPSGRHLGP